jgi:hypothetical protein
VNDRGVALFAGVDQIGWQSFFVKESTKVHNTFGCCTVAVNGPLPGDISNVERMLFSQGRFNRSPVPTRLQIYAGLSGKIASTRRHERRTVMARERSVVH